MSVNNALVETIERLEREKKSLERENKSLQRKNAMLEVKIARLGPKCENCGSTRDEWVDDWTCGRCYE